MIEVRQSVGEDGIGEASLVLSAAGIPHSLTYRAGLHRLSVDEEHFEAARSELAAFDSEAPRPTVAQPVAVRRGAWWTGSLVYAAIIVGVFFLEHGTEVPFPFRAAGRIDTQPMDAGEWFRTVTALTLHLDVAHVVGNLCFGVLFGGLLAHVVGNGVAWSTILTAGALGNLANVLARPGRHLSIGASTAVFGALGALVMWQWEYGRQGRVPWPKRLAPAAMGVAMLGYIGLGDENTDVLAHVFGFFAGVALGLLHFHFTARRELSRNTQITLSGLTLGVVTGAWWLARAAW